MAYCDFVRTEKAHPFHRAYHDEEYGVPAFDEAVLFERLSLEIAQAGLSWETVLKKREGYRRAFEGFEVDRLAAYGEADVARLLSDPGIIRNRLKVEATIHNAGVVQTLRREHGSFAAWLDAQGALSREEWARLFKRTFRFTGGEIVGEFLMSLGRLPGAHHQGCPKFRSSSS